MICKPTVHLDCCRKKENGVEIKHYLELRRMDLQFCKNDS